MMEINLTETAPESITFDNINLNTVDPNGIAMPLGTPFNFVINEAAVKEYATEKGSGKYTKIKFTVTDDNQFSGRPFYMTFFADKPGKKPYTAIKLRKIMDATGVVQSGEFGDWLTELVAERATLSCPLTERVDNRDNSKRVELDLFNVSPAQ